MIIEVLRMFAIVMGWWLLCGFVGFVISAISDIYNAKYENWNYTIRNMFEGFPFMVGLGAVGLGVAFYCALEIYIDSPFHKNRVQRRAERKRLRIERRKEKFGWWYAGLDTPIVRKTAEDKDR